MKSIFAKIKEKIEKIIPMTLGNMVIFVFLLYLIFIVGKSIVNNRQADQDLLDQEAKLDEFKQEIKYLQNEINYYQTDSYKEKEAREKLGYKGVGENVIVLPIDTGEEKTPDAGLAEQEIKVSNFRLWWQYFFGN